MYCMKCGQQLPNDAAFCFKCGVPQGAQAQATAPDELVQWEECEIITKMGILKSDFLAEVFGPNGHYVADKEMSDSNFKNGRINRKAIDKLVARLVAQGWEAQPRTGHDWYSYRFRRRVQERKPLAGGYIWGQ